MLCVKSITSSSSNVLKLKTISLVIMASLTSDISPQAYSPTTSSLTPRASSSPAPTSTSPSTWDLEPETWTANPRAS